MQTRRRREPLSARVTREVRDQISAGRYEVGAKLPSETEMVEEFGVSRTVIREAIANLRNEGRVVTMQGRGAFVARSDLPDAFSISHLGTSLAQDISAVFELRIALETEAAGLAALRRTPEDMVRINTAKVEMGDRTQAHKLSMDADMTFHRAIAKAAGNPHFVNLLDYLEEQLFPRRSVRPITEKSAAQQEHELIAYAIERQDAETARAAMRMHLTESRIRLLQRLEAETSSSRTPQRETRDLLTGELT